MQDTDIVRCGHCQLVEQATEALTAEQQYDFNQYLLGALIDLAPMADLRKAVDAAQCRLDAKGAAWTGATKIL